MQVNPYLLFNGNCSEALEFYEKTLGAKTEAKMTFAGSPAAEHAPPEWGDKVLHGVIVIGDTQVFVSDAPPGHYEEPKGLSLSLGLKDKAKGEQIFNALAENGKTTMPFQQTFWASGFGMCVDRFGIPWMVNCE